MKVSKGLTAPQSYLDAIPEVVAQVVNGCGPGGWKFDIIPDTVYGLSIKEACNIHDWRYTLGTSEADKDQADKEFLSNCLALVSNDKSFLGYALHYPRRLRAREYFEAVHCFGDNAFWAGKEQLKGATA